MARGAGKGLFGFFQSLLGGGRDLDVGGPSAPNALDPEMEAVKAQYMAVRVDDPEREAKLKAILDRIAAIRARRGG
jgi:hypothetical protein